MTSSALDVTFTPIWAVLLTMASKVTHNALDVRLVEAAEEWTRAPGAKM